jgi:hypothetical protein
MYFNKEDLEELRKKGLEDLESMDEEHKGLKYKSAADLQINCLHCNHDRFHRGNALLNTRGLTFFDLDWLNRGATTLVCNQCGFVHCGVCQGSCRVPFKLYRLVDLFFFSLNSRSLFRIQPYLILQTPVTRVT